MCTGLLRMLFCHMAVIARRRSEESSCCGRARPVETALSLTLSRLLGDSARLDCFGDVDMVLVLGGSGALCASSKGTVKLRLYKEINASREVMQGNCSTCIIRIRADLFMKGEDFWSKI